MIRYDNNGLNSRVFSIIIKLNWLCCFRTYLVSTRNVYLDSEEKTYIHCFLDLEKIDQ